VNYWIAVAASPALARKLKRNGFFQTGDVDGNIYYVLPNTGRLVFLRDPEGTGW
jgi:hypothetical protein